MAIQIEFDRFSTFIAENLHLIMGFSSMETKSRWGCYIMQNAYAYDTTTYTAEVFKGGAFSTLTNKIEFDNLPIFIIPVDAETNDVTFNIIDDVGKPTIPFTNIRYYGENNNLAYTQQLDSKIDISTEKDANVFFCRAKETNDDSYPRYFWILDCKNIDSVFEIKLPICHLKPSDTYTLSFSRSENDAQLKLRRIDALLDIDDPLKSSIEDALKWDLTNNCTLNITKAQFEEDIKLTTLLDGPAIVNGFINFKDSTELKIAYCQKNRFITSLQLNNEIFTKYYFNPGDKVNLLNDCFNQIKQLENAIKYTRKAQPFALLPDLAFTEPDTAYCLFNHYLVDSSHYNTIVTLISTGIELNAGTEIKLKGNKIAGLLELELLNLELVYNVENLVEVNDNGTFARVLIGKYSLSNPPDIIDGAFQFELNNVADYNDDVHNHNGKIAFVLQKKSTQSPLFFWQLKENDFDNSAWEIGYAIEDFSLPVKKVKPIGQDLSVNEKFLAPLSIGAAVNGYGERLQKQLIIPIGDGNKAENSYYLCISESVNIGQDFRVDMRLIEVDPKAGADKTTQINAVIIDSSPQFVGLVKSKFLVQKGYDDGVWVLAQKIQTSGNEGVWEIYDDQANEEGFNLILPAQTIGEEFIKSNLGDKDQIDSSEPLKYKFGAPATLNISSDKLEKKYVLPPWDLRKFWGKSGDHQPGLPLLQAEFELLYGLQGYIKPKDTSVAELGARLGDLPTPTNNNLAWKATAEQVNAFYENWIKYIEYYRAWKSRLAVLETYRNDRPKSEASFASPNLMNEELHYKPRLEFDLIGKDKEFIKKALPEIRQTIDEKEEEAKYFIIGRKGAEFKIPIKDLAGTIKIDGKNVDIQNIHQSLAGNDLSFLKGGFSYGFEDPEIYKSFLEKALSEGSSSAELSGLAFSSQGGYGKQVARFDNDLTAIKSLTAMGRVHRYAVERIGRIGVFWHKAKHAIEYERTVIRSDYEKSQPEFTGRPVVRKVREYVEILEPEKKYPDFDGHSTKDTGAVNACVFKSTIIPISNSWGKRVYKRNNNTQPIGWEVPLWYPGADEKLFPKPQVLLMLEAPKDSNIEQSIANLAAPENLFFYTSYGKEDTAEVGKWPSVYGVDFTDKLIFDESLLVPYNTESLNRDRLDELMPDTIDVLPGHGRFTFKVEPQLSPAGMANVYQPDSGLSGVLRTVSMQRNSEVTSRIYKTSPAQEYPLLNFLNSTSNNVAELKIELDTLFDNIKPPSLSHFTELNNKDGIDQKFPLNILWYKILMYASEFVDHIDDIYKKITAETDQLAFEKKRETALQNSNQFELNFQELQQIFSELFSISKEQNEILLGIKESINDTIIVNADKIKNDYDAFASSILSLLETLSEIKKQFEEIVDLTEFGETIASIAALIEEYRGQVDITLAEYTLAAQLIRKIEETDVAGIIHVKHKVDDSLVELFDNIKQVNSTVRDFILAIKIGTDSMPAFTDVKNEIEELLLKILFLILKTEDEIKKIEPFKTIGNFKSKIDTYLSEDNPDFVKAKSAIGQYYSEVTSKISQIDNVVASGAALGKEADNVLTNYRSVWEEITAPGMGLNRKTIALLINKIDNPKDLEQQLSITPCIARYKQFETDLNALGVRLPVTHIFNELKTPTEAWLKEKGAEIAKNFSDITFTEILPNLGGMDLAGMFKEFKDLNFLSDLSKHLKFSQGFDKQTLSAWANADLNYKLPGTQTLFSISVAKVELSDATFTARIQGNLTDGVLSKKEYGEILGDFTIKIGENSLMSFKATKIIYDNGKFNFDLDPNRMEMNGVLKLITDATKNLNQFNGKQPSKKDGGKKDDNSPFQVKILKAKIQQFLPDDTNENIDKASKKIQALKNFTETEIPYGIKATLDIPPVIIGGGTTSLTNLSFGAQFALRFFNVKDRKLEFVTGLGFYIGKQEAPFNFTAFIFGGGGFVNTLIHYSADSGTEIEFTMSVHASAGLCFNAGWISGSVFIYLGLEGQYTYRNPIGSNMSFAIFAQLVGTLNIMGLVSAYLIVRLAITYQGDTIRGDGYISISIEICWCLTIDVNRSFYQEFTGEQKSYDSGNQTSIENSLG
jgi:hypothetical protein